MHIYIYIYIYKKTKNSQWLVVSSVLIGSAGEPE